MRIPGFIGPSYTLNSVNVDCQRCINLYPEINEAGRGKEAEVASLVSTPGLVSRVTLGDGPIRGVYRASNDRLFAVSNTKLYEIAPDWTVTELGELLTASGPVSMADSGNYLAVVDGSVNGFLYKFDTGAFSPIPFPTDIDFKTFNGCPQVIFQDGYFVYFNKWTNYFFYSGQVGSVVADESTIDAADFGKSEGNPDPIVGIISCSRDIWMLNAESAEVFYNSGDANLPFERIQGAYVEFGCVAPFSIAKIGGSPFWLGRDEGGQGVVYSARGYQPQRISTHAVEQEIQKYGNLADAEAYTYQENGHNFYVLNFPSANTTWVYDANTGMWHERAYTNQGQLERHRANSHAFAFGKHIVGDYANGKIYEMSSQVYSDDGAEITRRRVAPHLSSGLKRVFYWAFQLDLESGVGLDGLGQGVDPKVMLRFSDDGGHKWSNEKWMSMGRIGQTKRRAIQRNLGQSRDRVFEVTITDPVKVALIGAEIEAEVGAS